jgi:hypothetical protein
MIASSSSNNAAVFPWISVDSSHQKTNKPMNFSGCGFVIEIQSNWGELPRTQTDLTPGAQALWSDSTAGQPI